LETNLFTPPKPNNVDPNELRELVRRGLVVEEDGIFFSPKAVRAATAIISTMLKSKPEGVTVGEIREGLHTTRKYALPLLAYLDNSGVTIRRGDVRFAGKRMPNQI
jgi:selenocysteine-specific elongation factor